MKSLKYLYITGILAAATGLFAEENTPADATALTVEGSVVHNAYDLFPSEYDNTNLKSVPAYLLKMSVDKQVLRLNGEYKKGLNLATHHMVALFNSDANKAIDAFSQLDASKQSEILLAAGPEFIRDYLVALSNATTKTWYCFTEERNNTYSDFKTTAKTRMNGPDDECTLEDHSRLRRTVLEEGELAKVLAWVENLDRYEILEMHSKSLMVLEPINMLFRYAESKSAAYEGDATQAMAHYLAVIFNELWDHDDETLPALDNILITGEWGSMHSAGANPQRKLSNEECSKFKGTFSNDMDSWNANGCDQPELMFVKSHLELNYLHALIQELDNANRIPLMERINKQGGLKSVLNKEICLSAEEDYFPFIDEDLLDEMFEICEPYMYADEIIEALQNEGQYLAIQG